MALLRADNFGWQTAAQLARLYTTVDDGSGSILVGSYGRASAPGIRFSGDAAAYIREAMTVYVPSGAVAIIQADLRISAAPAAVTALFRIMDGSTVQATLAIGTDRKLQVYRGDLTTALGSASTYVVPVNTFISIGLQLTIDGSAGGAIVHVWGPGDTSAQVVLNLTAQNTDAASSGAWDGYDVHAGSAGNTDWANLIVADGDAGINDALFGPADVSPRRPVDDSLGEWSPSTGLVHAAMVDDSTADDDVTYVQAAAANKSELYECQDLVDPSQTLFGVVVARVAKIVSGSPTVGGLSQEEPDTPEDGGTLPFGSSYSTIVEPMDYTPDGNDWTPAIFNASQFGIKVVSL